MHRMLQCKMLLLNCPRTRACMPVKQRGEVSPKMDAAAASVGEAFSIEHVLEDILSQLHFRDRMARAALVCQQWKAAATTVTAKEGIQLWYDGYDPDRDDHEREPSVVTWLNQHGSSLPSIMVHDGYLFRQGPKPFMSGLNQLTNLEMCCMRINPDVLKCLSLKNLRYMSVRHIEWRPASYYSQPPANYKEDALAWSQLWAGCNQLTYLKAENCNLNDWCMTGIGQHLKQLKTLELGSNEIRDARCLSPLPPSLTTLHLNDVNGHDSFDVSGCFTSAASLDTAMIASDASGQPRAAVPPLQLLDVGNSCLNQPSVLRRFTDLTSLRAEGFRSQHPGQLVSALAFLQNLQRLEIMPRKRGFYGVVFRRHDYDNVDDPPLRSCVLSSAQLAQLAASCPCLEHLSFAAFMPELSDHDEDVRLQLRQQRDEGNLPAAGLEPCDLQHLQSLPCLTSLKFWALPGCLQDLHLAQLAALTGLQTLSVCEAGGSLTDHGIQGLTQLTALTLLRISDIYKNAPGVSLVVAPADRYGGYDRSIYLDRNACEELQPRRSRSPVLHPTMEVLPTVEVDPTSDAE